RGPMLNPRFIVLKAIRFIATILAVTFFTAVLLQLTPGDPAYFMAGEQATPEQIAAINQEYGFNKSVFERYGEWLGNAVQGDFGRSYFTKQPVLDAIKERLPVTIELALLATLLSLAISVPMAVACARRPGSRFDRVVGAVTYAQISLP